jgi:hypothetical protein
MRSCLDPIQLGIVAWQLLENTGNLLGDQVGDAAAVRRVIDRASVSALVHA